MEAITNQFESLLSQAGEYAEARAKLIKLKVAEKTSETLADAASAAVALVFLVFFILIFSVGLALLIGDLLGKTYYGFFIVAGIYGIAGIIFRVNRANLIKTPVSNLIIKKIINPAE